MKETTSVIIPIKTNNTRLPGKNTMKLNGKPLYSYLFNTVKKVRGLDDVYIDSSDPMIWAIANEFGFKVLRRPECLNSDNTTGNELIQNVINNITSDILGQLFVTSPFIKSTTIDTAIRLLKENKQIESIIGVVERYNRYWYKGSPVNHDVTNLQRTQDLTPLQEESPDLYFFRRAAFLKYGNRVCGYKHFLPVNSIEAIDIDTLEDFQLAEACLKLGFIVQ